MPDRRMPEVGCPGCAIADTDGDGAGKTHPNVRSRKFLRNLPDRLIYRNAPAGSTRHELRGVVPATIDEAVDVLKVTGGTLVPVALCHLASAGTHRPTVRRFGRLADRDKFLPSLREWQDDERPRTIH
jgi:hypothetical protein